MRFSPALFLCLLGLPAAAQTRWQGTLSQTQNGLTAKATIFAQAPDRLRVEIARNDAAGISAQIIVATGDQTLRYEPATKRLFRARFSILKKWNRDWRLAAGGPANFVFAEAKPGVVSESEGRFARRDSVLFGGGGENAYYAAAKTPASLYPASVEIGPAQRLEKGVDGAQTMLATLTMKGGLPATATVTSAGETSVFNYDLTARTEPFPDATWTIDEAKSAVAQEIDVQAPTAYANANDPNELFNQGLALWNGAGDLIGAQTRFVAASKIASGASGPILASFEMALEARDYPSAQKALDALAPLELDAAEIEARRARLALAQRDWDGALSALDKAVAAAPDSAALQLGRAQALLGKGDIEGARAVWQRVATAPALPAARAQAATLLAQTADSNAAEGTNAADLAAAKQEAALSALARRVIGGEQIERNRRFALVLERAADDDNARVLWTELEARAPDDIKNQARAHLMTLAARAGDVAASLAAYGRLRDGLSLQSERENATFALFDAWQKAFNRAALASAIANRAVATRADDGDARLALAYQELYGDAESIETAVNSGLARSPNAAFWLSRRAELTTQTAFPLLTSNSASAARRAQLLNKARDGITQAIASDVKAGGDGSFYREQLTLISAQSAAKVLRSPDISTVLGESKTASAAVETLLASAPDDPDVLVSAALALQSFDADDGARRAIELAGRALLTKPGDGERHTLILAARQAMAFALVRLKRFPEAAAQFELLLLEARTAGEEVGIASNYIGMLEKTGDAQSAAGVVARIAGAPWDYAESRGALEALAARVALSPQVAPIEAALAREGSGAALLAWSQIATARLARANAALQVPGAPGSADADQERATRDLALAVDALKNARGAMPKYVEARVAVWLSEFGGLESDAALANLQRAVAIESRAPSLRLALAEALPDDAQSAAQLQLARQLAPASLETARLLSVAALDAGASESALQGSAEAYNAAAREPNVGTNAFQRIAFARARILWEAGETSAAVDIYHGLALPQWADTDRAASLLALRERYTAANRPDDAARVSDQIREMGLDMPTLQRAARFVEDVEN